MKAPPAGNGFTQHPSIVRHWFTASGALVALLQPEITAVAVFSSLAAGRLPLFLDSALHDALPASTDSAACAAVDNGTPSPTLPRLGRYSFVASDPIYSLQLDATYHAAGIAQPAHHSDDPRPTAVSRRFCWNGFV